MFLIFVHKGDGQIFAGDFHYLFLNNSSTVDFLHKSGLGTFKSLSPLLFIYNYCDLYLFLGQFF